MMRPQVFMDICSLAKQMTKVYITQTVRNEERKVKSEVFQRRQNAKSDHRELLPGKAHVPRNRK